MRQDVVSNVEIFNILKEELLKAKHEILVATAWFTDKELLEVLCVKQKSGVNVSVIISDNPENSKVDYTSLTNLGGSVKRIVRTGYGMMHHKFCIIDSNLAIHGSYNWTVNARKNNNESVIVTSHSKTIKELIKNHIEMLNTNTSSKDEKPSKFGRFMKILPNKKIIPILETKDDKKTKKDKDSKIYDEIDSSVEEFRKILNELIESEIFKFDKEKFISEGFERAKLTNGDHQTLPNTLETLYADFVNSLDIAQEKKDTLFVNIKELKNSKVNKLKLERDSEINIIESETKAKESQLNKEIENLSAKITNKDIEKDKIKNIEIDTCTKKIEGFNGEIENLKIDFVKTNLRWHELAPAIIIATILLAYLIIFYSSAAYILIFSTLDAKLSQMNGVPIVPTEVFDPKAISKAFGKGGTAPLFMVLFVIIPVGLAIIKKFFAKVTVYTNIFIWVSILLVDTLIAYIVAKSIHEVDYLAGRAEEAWKYSDFYTNENFFLVFIMGALGLVIFKFAYEKIHNSLDERNKDVSRAKNHVIISQLKEKIEKNEKKKKIYESKVATIDQQVVLLEKDKTNLDKNLSELTVILDRQKQFLNKNYEVKITEIEDVVTIYQTRIDNNDLKFSISSLKDRVNTFLEGWINYLHDTYSVHKAIEMSSDAGVTKNQWIDLKVNSHEI